MKKRSLLLFLFCALFFAIALVGCGEDKPSALTSSGDEHEHGEYEWIGEFELNAGKYLFQFDASEDPTMDVGFIKMGANVVDLDDYAAHLMLTDKEMIEQNSEFEAKSDYAYSFEMNEDRGRIYFTIKDDGVYAIITEHLPEESNMRIFDANNAEILPIREHEALEHIH